MKRFLGPLLLAAVLSVESSAQITNPIRYTWIASSCETWNCAAAALVLANGDPHVIVLPTGRSDRPWVVVKRVEEGSIFIPEDEPFYCEVFETLTAAVSMYGSVDGCRAPLILNVPDGRVVLTSLHKCSDAPTRRRSMR